MTTPGRSSPSPSVTTCLDRLEALLGSGPPMFPPSRRVAWEDARELVRALRDALAADTKRVSAPGPEVEAVLRRANDEARRIVQEAEDSARRALEDGTLAHAAEQQLQQVREQAVREADETRRSADMYAMTVLERLEREVARILATVQRGKAVLSERTGRTPPVTGNAARLDNGKLASV